MIVPDRITFRPGKLAGPMGRKIKATGETPSAYVRRLIAEDCDKPVPKMDGHIKAIKKVNRDRKSH